jgi:hypothetical protein
MEPERMTVRVATSRGKPAVAAFHRETGFMEEKKCHQ